MTIIMSESDEESICTGKPHGNFRKVTCMKLQVNRESTALDMIPVTYSLSDLEFVTSLSLTYPNRNHISANFY